ncbi:hypothetical protein EVAR_18379_1 [Eumeta japonica]|uniref:Uncharacterized protein n=1 Tax=Eumeta variegata TaxID=151549 RepID=A0A4C1UUB9_EUMVA|nr:hypothetical protein EVAR_18379_1 [Eumeta japonica]
MPRRVDGGYAITKKCSPSLRISGGSEVKVPPELSLTGRDPTAEAATSRSADPISMKLVVTRARAPRAGNYHTMADTFAGPWAYLLIWAAKEEGSAADATEKTVLRCIHHY